MKFAKTVVFLVACSSFLARADVIYTLNADGCSSGCGVNGQGSTDNDFGTIDLHFDGTNSGVGSVTVTETLNGVKFVNSSGKEAIGFNLASSITDVTISSISTGYSEASGSSFSMPPFGDFTDAIHCTACGNGGSNPQPGPLSFTVSAKGLTIADFVANNKGDFFASDVIGLVTKKTGDIAANMAPVPEPGFYGVLALGLGGLFMAVRSRRKPASSRA